MDRRGEVPLLFALGGSTHTLPQGFVTIELVYMCMHTRA